MLEKESEHIEHWLKTCGVTEENFKEYTIYSHYIDWNNDCQYTVLTLNGTPISAMKIMKYFTNEEIRTEMKVVALEEIEQFMKDRSHGHYKGRFDVAEGIHAEKR